MARRKARVKPRPYSFGGRANPTSAQKRSAPSAPGARGEVVAPWSLYANNPRRRRRV